MEGIARADARHAAFGPRPSIAVPAGDGVSCLAHGGISPGVGETHPSIAAIALDALAEGAFMMSADCRLLYANRAARSILASAAMLRLWGGRVRPTGPDVDGAFARMVMTTATGGATGAMCLRGALKTRLNITTKPVRSAGGVLMLAAAIHRGDRQIAAQLQRAFGLTPAEADIARSLSTGASPADTALARGALLSTVQSQIKSIASKLGCRRQSEITAIVQAMPRFLED